MVLVTEGKGRIFQLGYDLKKGEYVALYRGKEQWREKGDTELLDFFNDARLQHTSINEEKLRALKSYNIFDKYELTCQEICFR